MGKNFFVREICDAWRGSALGFSVRTVVLESILGLPYTGEPRRVLCAAKHPEIPSLHTKKLQIEPHGIF